MSFLTSAEQQPVWPKWRLQYNLFKVPFITQDSLELVDYLVTSPKIKNSFDK